MLLQEEAVLTEKQTQQIKGLIQIQTVTNDLRQTILIIPKVTILDHPATEVLLT